jgi:hypothetical protein
MIIDEGRNPNITKNKAQSKIKLKISKLKVSSNNIINMKGSKLERKV